MPKRSYKDLVKGDIVVFTNGHGLYGGVNHMTPFKDYVLQKTPEQEIWRISPADIPFYPELKLPVLNDQGHLVQLKASRFMPKENFDG